MMSLDEMKLAVCGKLSELIETTPSKRMYWHFINDVSQTKEILWPTEGLQVCHEAEKLMRKNQFHFVDYQRELWKVVNPQIKYTGVLGYIGFEFITATYEQRLEALCRVWWPERLE